MTSKDIKPVIEQPATEIPLMLAQAIIVAGVLAIGEIACSPLYFTLMDHSLALVPWALEAAFLAVAFTFVVGFALLWCAESFTFKLKEQFRPFGYAAVGLIGYGVWSCWCSPPPSIRYSPRSGKAFLPTARSARSR